MGFRDTGKTETVKKQIQECFCDFCDTTIQDSAYPEIRLEIQWSHYYGDGDQPDNLYFCSFNCLRGYASKIVNKNVW